MLSLLSFVFGFPAQIWQQSGGDGGPRQTVDDWDAAKKEEAGSDSETMMERWEVQNQQRLPNITQCLMPPQLLQSVKTGKGNISLMYQLAVYSSALIVKQNVFFNFLMFQLKTMLLDAGEVKSDGQSLSFFCERNTMYKNTP